MPSLEKLGVFRRMLHAHPEISGQEQETAARVEKRLRELKADEVITQLGGHGILATFEGTAPGPSILFRAELDALPIFEVNGFAHRSGVDGVSHKCGHDGHTAILCGLAEWLAQQRPTRGRVHLLFQPAEETGEGAKAVLLDPKFDAVRPDMAFALHNFPGHPCGQVVLCDTTVTAAVSSLVIRLQGRTAHASQPEFGLNPTQAATEILQQIQGFNQPDPSQDDFCLITPVHVRIGSVAYGVAAGDGEIHLTLRSWTNTKLEQLRAKTIALCQHLAARDGLSAQFQTLQDFASVQNDAATNEVAKQATIACGLTLVEHSPPVKGGEDFGLFTARFPCTYLFLGAGETPALHNPDYDFPDGLLELGVKLWHRIVQQLLC